MHGSRTLFVAASTEAQAVDLIKAEDWGQGTLLWAGNARRISVIGGSPIYQVDATFSWPDDAPRKARKVKT